MYTHWCLLGHRELLCSKMALSIVGGTEDTNRVLLGSQRGRVHVCLRYIKGEQSCYSGTEFCPGLYFYAYMYVYVYK